MRKFAALCLWSSALAASSLPAAAQAQGDLAARVKAGESWGTSAVSTGEIAACWATWIALRDHIAANGLGGFPADYDVATLDKRIAEWNRAMDVAFKARRSERVPTSNAALEEARAEVGGSGLAGRAERSGNCKTLPGGVRSKVVAAPAAPAPVRASAPASAPAGDWRAARDGTSEAAQWRRKGRAYFLGEGVAKDPEQALFWTRKAADAGLASAQFDMAVFHLQEYGGLRNDPVQVFNWMKKAAEGGIASAQDNVGLFYFQGAGTAKDYAEATRWFRRAAEQGDSQGQVDLGTQYWFGRGVAENPAEAVGWFRKSAEQGNAEGQFWLGNAYRRGLGVAQNIPEARRWLRASAAQGDENAVSMLSFLDEVDRQFAARERAILAGQARRDSATGPSLYDQVMATVERQRRENCAAAAQGANEAALPGEATLRSGHGRHPARLCGVRSSTREAVRRRMPTQAHMTDRAHAPSTEN